MDSYPCHCLLCDRSTDESAWDARDRSIAANVRAHGWNIMGVGGGDHTPGWSYSIGLWHTLRSPEVSVFGLPTDTARRALNVLGDRIRDGAELRPDERRTDVLNDYEVNIRPARHVGR